MMQSVMLDLLAKNDTRNLIFIISSHTDIRVCILSMMGVAVTTVVQTFKHSRVRKYNHAGQLTTRMHSIWTSVAVINSRTNF